MTHKFDGTKKPKDYPREITRIVKIEKPKPKPKPIPLKPKPQHLIPDDEGIMFDPDDPLKDLYGIKLASQPSLEESNAEWWQNEYFEYRKNGGALPFLQFKQMMINEADIDMTKKINKIMKDKMRGEGLAALLGVRA